MASQPGVGQGLCGSPKSTLPPLADRSHASIIAAMLLCRHVSGMHDALHGSVKVCEKFLLYGNTRLQPEPWIDESADGWEDARPASKTILFLSSAA